MPAPETSKRLLILPRWESWIDRSWVSLILKSRRQQRGGIVSERIILRTGEALVEGPEDHLCAELEIVIGELNGPVGHALANLIGNQVKGHSRVFAILNSDVQVRPATVMVRSATVLPKW